MDEFLLKCKEDSNLNQYWYSSGTIRCLVSEALDHSKKAAFLSTPSVFFSLPEGDLRKESCIFDFDDKWKNMNGFVKYDFNKPDDIEEKYQHSFDFVLVDPPFITEDAWEKYASSAKLLLCEGGKVLVSTVAENEGMLRELLGTTRCKFMPSIPHLVYQYSFFANYESPRLSVANPEILE